MKKATLLILISCYFITFLFANRQFECYVAPVESKLGLKKFPTVLEGDLQTRLSSDSSIQVLKAEKKGSMSLKMVLRKDLRFPENEAVFATITRANQKDTFLTLLYKTEDRVNHPQKLSQQINQITIRQLKAESIPDISRNLSSDMNHNIFHVKLDAQKLQVELLGKQTDNKHQWEDKVDKTVERSLPIAKKKQIPEQKRVFGLKDQNKPPELNPLTQEPEPKKRAPIPMDPYSGTNKPKRTEHYAKYPNLQNGGLAALIITPQLSEQENKKGERFSFSTYTSVTFENFENTVGTSTYRFDGRFIQQKLALSTRLWSRLNLGLESAYALRDSDVQFDALHPTAAGGTTFLPSSQLDWGITDTTIIASWYSDLESFTLRPVLKVKLPTGSESDLLGSGHVDYSLGVMANIPLNTWTWGVALHLIIPGDIGNFDPAQGDLPATSSIAFQTGMAKTVDFYGPLDLSFAYHFMQNPLRELSPMPETEEDIHSIGLLLEKDLKSNWSFQTQASAGLSPSASNASVSLGFIYSH